MCVGSPTAGAWSSFQRRPDDEFETDRLLSATWLDSYSLAYTVASLLNQLFGKGKEPFWQLAYTNLVRWIIELYRVLPGGWVTLRDVYHCAIDKELFARKITQAQTYAADMSDTWITIRRRR